MLEGSGISRFFLNNWEKMLLWAILIGLFYLLKPLFLLIFETFLITYVTKGGVEWLVRRLNLNYRLATVMVFVLFVGLLGMAGAWIGPRLAIESNKILTRFAGDGEEQTQDKIDRFVEKTVVKMFGEERAKAVISSDEYIAMMDALETETTRAVKAAVPDVLRTLLHAVKVGWEVLVSLFLAIIFSLVLVMDWRIICGKMKELEESRIRTFYLGAAPHLRAFANVLGKAFRAQAIIATCNTVLTAAGLHVFGVPNVVLLSTLVFVCGFIPILGTFLSSIPILLFGAEVGGLALTIQLVALIAVIHVIEAYVLNPKITADVLHVHPILVLILLLLGERFFGVWGMVVGVPVGTYVISVLMEADDGPAPAEAQPPGA